MVKGVITVSPDPKDMNSALLDPKGTDSASLNPGGTVFVSPDLEGADLVSGGSVGLMGARTVSNHTDRKARA
jgi:hypothetical protein